MSSAGTIRFLTAAAAIGWRALSRHRLRSGLTTLGIVIGVAAVIAMVALGNGAKASMARTLRSAGTSIVQVSAGNYIRGGESVNITSGLGAATTLTADDAAAIRSIDGVQHITAERRARAWVGASAEARSFAVVLGTEPAIADIYGWTFLSGDTFTASDVNDGRAVVVLGRVLSAKLFGDGVDPQGRQVTMLGHPFTIVGWMRAADAAQDEGAFVPVTTLGSLLGQAHLQQITIGVTDAGIATRVSDDVRILLRQRHVRGRAATSAARTSGALGGLQGPGAAQASAADDFVVRTLAGQQVTKGLYTEVAAFALANMPKLDSATMEEMAGTLNRAGNTMTALLASIAAISLIVGGIGIMNVMLVSVSERTREIGLRLAVGARRREVLLQFLIEAVVLSLIGSILGVVAGLGAAHGLTALMEWPTTVSPEAIALAIGIAAVVGILFGYYPARRASRLDPIVALRRD
jgi:putative ABC transport system permease protein